MMLLGWRLKQAHYRIHYFAYVSAWETFERITARFVDMIRQKIGPAPYVIVAHSLGGLIARAALPNLDDYPPRRLVMMASPNQPAHVAKLARLNPVYCWFTGDCGRKLADDTFYETLPHPNIPTTIIAGTSGPQSPFLPLGTAVNDGVLTVEETALGQDDEVIVARGLHPLIMNSKDVARLIVELLELAE